MSGACFAEFGAEVTCVDVDERKIACLNEREIAIYEPSLQDLVMPEPEHMSARGFEYAGVRR